MQDDGRKLEGIEAKLLEALNDLYAYRRSHTQASAEDDPFISLKEAARLIKKSPKATRTRAEKIPGCLRWDGGRWKVNRQLIQMVLVAPPKSRRRV